MTGSAAPPPGNSPAEARHLVENLLVAYTRAVDERDLAGVTRLLAGVEVAFDDGPTLSGSAIGEAYARTFDTAGSTRHIVCSGSVDHDRETGAGASWFPYQRWSLDEEAPVLTALGRYSLRYQLDDEVVRIGVLEVRRDWQRSG